VLDVEPQVSGLVDGQPPDAVDHHPVDLTADVVIIDRDLTKIAPETIREAKIRYTIVGGRVTYDREAASR